MAQYKKTDFQPQNNSPAHNSAAPVPTVIRLTQQQRQKSNPALWLTLLLFLGLFGIICFILLAVIASYAFYQSSSRVIPGVYVGKIYIGGMTKEEASNILQKYWDFENQIEVTNGIESKHVKADEIGLSMDTSATVQKAMNIAHGQSMFAEMVQMFASIIDKQEISPIVEFDNETAEQKLTILAQEMQKAPIDASLLVEEDKLLAIPSELGYSINIQATLEMMEADPQAILISEKLQVIPQPIAARITDVTPALEEAQRFLDTPINLTIYDAITDEYIDISVPKDTLANWLIIEAGPNGPQVTFDEYKVAADLTNLSEELGGWRYLKGERFSKQLAQAVREGTPFPVIIASHTSTTYTTKPGDTLLKISWNNGMPLWKILNANPDLDPNNVWAGINLTIPSKDTMLPLPVIPNKRIVINISKQRLWVYQDGQKVGQHVISTGIDRSPTQPGIFQVQSHETNAYASVWDLYMPNFLGIYESWPGFMNGIHGLPTLSNGQRLWANILGSPASYGCIIIDLETSDWLYEWAEDGVVVEIRN